MESRGWQPGSGRIDRQQARPGRECGRLDLARSQGWNRHRQVRRGEIHPAYGNARRSRSPIRLPKLGRRRETVPDSLYCDIHILCREIVPGRRVVQNHSSIAPSDSPRWDGDFRCSLNFAKLDQLEKLWRKDFEWGRRCRNRGRAREAAAEAPQLFSEAIGSHEEVSGREAAGNAVMADSGQRQGGDTAALGAVGISSELARSDARSEISGDGLRGSGEYAFLWTSRRRGDLADECFGHVEGGVFEPQLTQIGDECGSLRGSEYFWIASAALGREDAEPNLFHLVPAGPEAEELIEVAGTSGDL
jgi:hypothetical protein